MVNFREWEELQLAYKIETDFQRSTVTGENVIITKYSDVLDLTHDKFALAALRAYQVACREEYPLLAADLDQKIKEIMDVPF